MPYEKVDESLVNDVYEKAQMEIIAKRRESLGANVRYMQKESEVKFENKRIKFLRRALMIIKMNSQTSASRFFQEVEEEYMRALEENLDYREESELLQYDIDMLNKQDLL